MDRAKHLDAVAGQKDGLPRQQALELIDRLEQEASDCKQLVQYNEAVQTREEQELEDAKAAAVKMVQDAEERLEQTRQILSEKMAQLAELEVQADETFNSCTGQTVKESNRK